MGYLAVFLLMGGTAVLIKFFVDRGSGAIAGLVSTLPIRVVYALVLVAMANQSQAASATVRGVLAGLVSIFLMGLSILVGLRFFEVRLSVGLGILVWLLAATLGVVLRRGA